MPIISQSWKNATEQLVKMLQGCQVLVHLRCRLIHHVQSFVPEILAETHPCPEQRLKHLPLHWSICRCDLGFTPRCYGLPPLASEFVPATVSLCTVFQQQKWWKKTCIETCSERLIRSLGKSRYQRISDIIGSTRVNECQCRLSVATLRSCEGRRWHFPVLLRYGFWDSSLKPKCIASGAWKLGLWKPLDKTKSPWVPALLMTVVRQVDRFSSSDFGTNMESAKWQVTINMKQRRMQWKHIETKLWPIQILSNLSICSKASDFFPKVHIVHSQLNRRTRASARTTTGIGIRHTVDELLRQTSPIVLSTIFSFKAVNRFLKDKTSENRGSHSNLCESHQWHIFSLLNWKAPLWRTVNFRMRR